MIIMIILVVYLVFFKYGFICFGKDGEKLKYNYLFWLFMLFGVGMGIGFFFYGIVELILYFIDLLIGKVGIEESVKFVM